MDWQSRALELEALLEQERLKTSNFQKIQEFHRVFGRKPDPIKPSEITPDSRLLRGNLMFEEFKELITELGLELYFDYEDIGIKIGFDADASDTIDLSKVAKETSDLLYVTYGTAASMGLPIDDVYEAVHKSNMSKMGDDGKPVRREDGKILKGPNYKEPDIESIIRKHS